MKEKTSAGAAKIEQAECNQARLRLLRRSLFYLKNLSKKLHPIDILRKFASGMAVVSDCLRTLRTSKMISITLPFDSRKSRKLKRISQWIASDAHTLYHKAWAAPAVLLVRVVREPTWAKCRRVCPRLLFLLFAIVPMAATSQTSSQAKSGSVEKYWGCFFLFHSILYLCIMNMLEQLARIVLPKEILDNFDIVKIETDESDIDAMSLTIHLDERMNAYLQKSEDYESKGFMDAVRITDFPIRDHKVILVLRRRRWRNKETGETFVDRISVTESGTRYSKEFAAFLKETYGHIPDDLPYA